LNVAREWNYRTQQLKIRNLSGEEGHERVINHEEERAYVAAAPELLRDFATIGLDSKRNVPLSARVKCIFERRHKEAGKPQMGLVFGRETVARSRIARSLCSTIER
jgi:hypothetical protein